MKLRVCSSSNIYWPECNDSPNNLIKAFELFRFYADFEISKQVSRSRTSLPRVCINQSNYSNLRCYAEHDGLVFLPIFHHLHTINPIISTSREQLNAIVVEQRDFKVRHGVSQSSRKLMKADCSFCSWNRIEREKKGKLTRNLNQIECLIACLIAQ